MIESRTTPRHVPSLVALGIAVVFVALAVLHPGRDARVLRHVLTWTSTAALTALFLWGASHVVRTGLPSRRAWGGAWLLAIVALFVPAFHSSDLYAYAQTGWLQVAYDANPYVTLVADVPEAADDPMFTTTWRDVPCVYGFLFAHLSRAPARLSGGDVDAARCWFRVFGALTLLAVAWLLARVLALEDRAAGPALYWLAWSPFVLLHFVANGHNDLLFGLFVLIALAAALEGRAGPVLPALFLAVLTKVVAVVLLPFAALYLARRHGARALVGSLAAGLGVAAVVSLPYVLDVGAFRLEAIWQEWTRPAHSLTSSITGTVAAFDAGAAAAVVSVLRAVLLGAYAVLCGWRFVRAWRAPRYEARDLLRDSVLLLLLLIAAVSAKFHPWYLGMVLPAALVLPDRDPLRRLTLWLTVTWLLAFTGLGKARILEFLLLTGVPVALFVVRERRGADPAAAAAPEGGLGS